MFGCIMSDESEPPDQRSRREWLRRAFPNLREPLLSETVGRLQFIHVPAGSAVVRQGDDADALYIIVSGQVSVLRMDGQAGQVAIATLGPGQFFGEMALLAGESRSASVYAETDLKALRLDREGFRRIVEKDSGPARSSTIADRQAAAPASPARQQDPWLRTVRSACHALVASHHAVHSIDVLGRPVEDDGPSTLLRLAELARRTASEYGVEVRVSQVGERPLLHLMTGPTD